MGDSKLTESGEAGAPRCFVVGMGSLAVTGVRVLQDAGYRILGLHSPDASLADVAQSCRIPYYNALAEFEAGLAAGEFEWLFSLNNPWMIPAAVLRLPQMATINYHDSPLPRYRGMHATTWALIHGETAHAISFHEVTEGIDAGRTFRQAEVSIEPEDTAWSLNAKCFEKAIETFEELVEDLRHLTSRDAIVAKDQDASKQSYFGRWERPRQAAIIDFDKSAESIRDLVRALDFGPIENALGTPKLYLGDRIVSVGRAEILSERVSGSGGELVRNSNESIDVTTFTGIVRLSRITALDSESVDLDGLVELVRGRGDRRLPQLNEQQAEMVTRRYGELCRHEAYWLRLLIGARPGEIGQAFGDIQCEGTRELMPEFSAAIMALERETIVARVADCLAVFLSKANASEAFDMGFSVKEPDPLLAMLFSPVVPIHVEPNPEQPLVEFLKQFAETFDRAKSKGTFAKDIVLRYPELRDKKRFRYGVAFGAHHSEVTSEVAELYVGVDAEQRKIWLTHHGALQSWQVKSLDDALSRIALEARSPNATTVARVPWMSDLVARKVIVDWNEHPVDIPDESMYCLIERTAMQQPQAGAVRAAGVSLSYAELIGKSRQLAQQLIRSGVRSGDLVALSLPRSCDWVVAMLGILQTGAAYLPIDPAYPKERGWAMLEDARVSIAVSQRALRDKFFNTLSHVVLMEELADGDPAPACSAGPLERLAPEIDGQGLFCVIYTSGSTGKPKGVEVTHRGMVNHGLAIARNYSLGPGDRVLCSASIGFDVVGEQIYPALIAGAEIVIRPEDLFDSFKRFQDFVTDAGITVMILPTSFWHEWTRELFSTHAQPPSTLRALSVGTEKALGETLAQWEAVSRGRVRFFQGYGPTETTITSTMYLHDGQSADADLPIGRPLPNTQVYLLDVGLQPVPIGNVGELYIAGTGLARGYRNAPTMTAERFLECPFRSNTRMYRTGDMARYRPDGQLVFLGRADSQVKIRGFRVELAEIEQALRTHPDISDAIVLLRSDSGEPQLVGYVVQFTNGADAAALQEFVAQRLPHYMVPQAVVRLARFPKTPNQKIDKRALPAPPRSAPVSLATDTLALNPLQENLLDIWRDLLGQRPRLDDDFFAIGGHSLLAVRMLSVVERRHKTLVPLSQFVQNPTILGLERVLSTHDTEASLVVTVQAGTERPPLWLVHPVGGHVVYAYRLRKYMAPYQPIMGLQAQGVDGRLPPLENIVDMAKLYVQRIREIQPHGPYFVAGPSMGGLIALEIAQLLRRRGEEVALLALIDTWGPGYPRPTSRLRKVLDQFQTILLQRNWHERFALIRDRWHRRHEAQVVSRGRVMPQHYDLPDGTPISPEMLAAIRRVWEANERANFAYEPSAYSGSLLLIRASLNVRWPGMRFDDPFNGWCELATGEFECRTLDVGHSELADDPPASAATCLQAAIDVAWERVSAQASVRCAS